MPTFHAYSSADMKNADMKNLGVQILASMQFSNQLFKVPDTNQLKTVPPGCRHNFAKDNSKIAISNFYMHFLHSPRL